MIEGIVLIIVMFVGAFVITGYAFLAKESRATFEELDIDGNGELTMNEITEHRMMDFNSADTDDD